MCRFRFFDKTYESGGIVNRNISQNLAVQIDSGTLQAAYEFAVGNSGGAAPGVDAHNPERPEIALFQPAADIAVSERLFDGFLRGAVQL